MNLLSEFKTCKITVYILISTLVIFAQFLPSPANAGEMVVGLAINRLQWPDTSDEIALGGNISVSGGTIEIAGSSQTGKNYQRGLSELGGLLCDIQNDIKHNTGKMTMSLVLAGIPPDLKTQKSLLGNRWFNVNTRAKGILKIRGELYLGTLDSQLSALREHVQPTYRKIHLDAEDFIVLEKEGSQSRSVTNK